MPGLSAQYAAQSQRNFEQAFNQAAAGISSAFPPPAACTPVRRAIVTKDTPPRALFSMRRMEVMARKVVGETFFAMTCVADAPALSKPLLDSTKTANWKLLASSIHVARGQSSGLRAKERQG